MLESITHTMLTSAMGFAWPLISVGERAVVYAESFETERAGIVELTIWHLGGAIVRAGEGLELGVNSLAMRLGYSDGEVSGVIAFAN